MKIGQDDSKSSVNIIFKQGLNKTKQNKTNMDAFLSFISSRTFVQNVIPIKNTITRNNQLVGRKTIPGQNIIANYIVNVRPFKGK